MTVRRETLVSVHRAGNCVFELVVRLDEEEGDKGIAFVESYDYGRLGDDPGQESAYMAYAAYSSLETLVGFFGVDPF